MQPRAHHYLDKHKTASSNQERNNRADFFFHHDPHYDAIISVADNYVIKSEESRKR